MNDDPDALLARAYALGSADEALELYRDWATTYDATMLDGLGYESPRRVAALLADHVPDRSALVLDVGCGTGLAGVALAAHGFGRLEGIDLSAEMLEVASTRRLFDRLVVADLLEPLPFETGRFDAAICSGTFTHAHVGAGCIDEILRVIRPGGVFACTIHRDVYEPAGFAEAFRRLEDTGVIEVIARELGGYYTTSSDPEGHYCVLRRRLDDAAGTLEW